MIRVLTIDGGGILGVVPALILRDLEQRIQRKTGQPDARLVDYFDFFAGTSTGGIITALLLTPDPDRPGRPKFSTEDIVGFYLQNGPDIFKTTAFRRALGSVGLVSERYEVVELERLLKKYIGEVKMSQLLKPCLVPAYNLELAATYFFCSHDHAGQVQPAREFLVRDMCRATSAAPSYFAPAIFESASKVTHSFIDGGVFANNPTLCAIAEVGKTEQQYNPTQLLLLSLGTGKVKEVFQASAFQRKIALLNIPKLINIMMGGVAQTTHHIVRNVFENLAAANNYLRLEPDLPNAQVGAMDNASVSNISRLQAVTEQFIEHHADALEDWATRIIQDSDLESAGPRLSYAP